MSASHQDANIWLSGNPRISALGMVQSPRSARVLAGFFAGFILLFVLALIFAPWQQTVSGSGRVIAYAQVERQQVIQAPIEGRVTRWLVQEGSRVKAGDKIVDITDNDPEIMNRLQRERATLETRLKAAQERMRSMSSQVASYEQSRTFGLTAAAARVSMARDRYAAAQQALTAAEAAFTTAKLNLERQKALMEKGLTSARNVELAELEYARTRTEADRARAQVNAAKAEQMALEADQTKFAGDAMAKIEYARAELEKARADEASILGELARMDIRLARQSTQEVTAPRDGVIFRIIAFEGGSLLKPGDDLAILVPDTESRAVELWVDGNDAPLLSKGRHVRIQFEGWPAIQFTGWPSVAVGTFGGKVDFVDSHDNGRGQFRVVVVPDASRDDRDAWPSGNYLRQGVRARGWFFLNEVTLGYEFWRQFNGFPPVIAQEEPGKEDKPGKPGGGKKDDPFQPREGGK
ncbi:MAG: hypothetical protein GMKNLPBB_00600 [Myxococcota bacterium]|nr:hypothetical protein [Myxococcota bacterium]